MNEKIREALRRQSARETIEFPGGLVLEILAPTVGQIMRYWKRMKPGTTAEGLDQNEALDAMAELISMCLFDPDSGERVFSDDDHGQVLDFIDGKTLDVISKRIFEMTDRMHAAAGKESGEMASSEPVSSSPTRSGSRSKKSTRSRSKSSKSTSRGSSTKTTK